MLPRLLLLALSLSLCACASMPPPHAPAEIPPPPVALATKCPVPDDLAGSVSAQDLIGWTMEWINAFACERGKRGRMIGASMISAAR
jgi:hypothetical protein